MNNSDSFDDIPDTIEIDGKTHPFDKERYRKWATEGGKRILAFTKNGPLKVKLGDEMFAMWDPGEFIKINPDGKGTTIQLKEPGPKIREGLVGIAGMYYHPENIGTTNTDEVVSSWNWLFDRNNFPKIDFENFLEGFFILQMITTGKNQIVLYHIMSLAVDLKSLFDAGIEVKQKITELMSKIKGNWRKFNRLNRSQSAFALKQMNDMTLTIADVLAESKLATAAHDYHLQVKMTKSPDIIIENVRVEVKFDRRFLMNDRGFENKVTKGLKQGGELIAIYTGNFKMKKLKNSKLTWLATENLETSLLLALEYCKNGKKCVLLFTGTSKGEIGRVAIIRN